MTLDFSTDYLVFDNLQAVTLINRTNAGDTSVAITQAHVGQITRKQIEASDGKYRGDDLAVMLFRTLLYGYEPKPRDGLTIDGTTYRIVDPVMKQVFGEMWMCACRNPIIVYELRQIGHIYRPVRQNGQLIRLDPLYLNLNCRVQIIRRTKGDEEVDQMTLQRQYRIPVSQEIPLAIRSDQFQLDDGTKYEITAIETEETLDGLPVITADLSL